MKAPSPWNLRKPVVVGLVVALIIRLPVQAFFLIRRSSKKELNTDLVKRLDSLMLSIAGMDENELKVSIEGRTVTGTTEVTVRVRG